MSNRRYTVSYIKMVKHIAQFMVGDTLGEPELVSVWWNTSTKRAMCLKCFLSSCRLALAVKRSVSDGGYSRYFKALDGLSETPGTAACGHDCHFEAPYGFVPESDCPVHDAVEIVQWIRGGTITEIDHA